MPSLNKFYAPECGDETDLYHEPPLTPEKKLLRAVLFQAAQDLFDPLCALNEHYRRTARNWFLDSDFSAFSCREICHLIYPDGEERYQHLRRLAINCMI